MPNGVGVTADFSTLDLTADTTVTLDGSKTASALIFGDTAPSNNWSIGAGSGGTLFLSAGPATIPTITVNAGTTVTMNVALNVANNYYKLGGGTLNLTTAASGTGTVIVQAGILSLTNANQISTAPGRLELDGGTLQFRANQSNPTSSRVFVVGPTLGSPLTASTGTIDVTGGSTFTFGQVLANNSGGVGSLVVSGAGAVVFGGANSYTGSTTIRGTLRPTVALTNGGIAGPLGASSNAASNLVLDGGDLAYSAGSATIDRLFSLTPKGGTIELVSGTTAALSFSNTGAIAYTGFTGTETLTTLSLGSVTTGASQLGLTLADAPFGSTLVKNGGGDLGHHRQQHLHRRHDHQRRNSGPRQQHDHRQPRKRRDHRQRISEHQSQQFHLAREQTQRRRDDQQAPEHHASLHRLRADFGGTFTWLAGAVAITGALGSASINVLTGGTLSAAGDGVTTGLVGNVTLNTGGNLRPGATGNDGDIATLTASNLNINGGDIRLDVTNTSSPADQIVVTGGVNFNGASTISFPTVPSAGTYVLISSPNSGMNIGTMPTVNVPTGTRRRFNSTTPPTRPSSISSSAPSPKSLTWTGTNSPAWDLTTTQNWSDLSNGSTDELFFNQDTVNFNNAGTVKTVQLDTTVLPTAVNFNNTSGERLRHHRRWRHQRRRQRDQIRNGFGYVRGQQFLHRQYDDQSPAHSRSAAAGPSVLSAQEMSSTTAPSSSTAATRPPTAASSAAREMSSTSPRHPRAGRQQHLHRRNDDHFRHPASRRRWDLG